MFDYYQFCPGHLAASAAAQSPDEASPAVVLQLVLFDVAGVVPTAAADVGDVDPDVVLQQVHFDVVAVVPTAAADVGDVDPDVALQQVHFDVVAVVPTAAADVGDVDLDVAHVVHMTENDPVYARAVHSRVYYVYISTADDA